MSALKRPLKRRSLGQVTGFLIAMSAASRILGYVREIVLTTSFGQSSLTDAYKSAFLIPDFLYLVLVGGAFSTAFIPVLSGYLAKDEEDEVWTVSSTILNLVLLLVSAGIGLCFIFAPLLVREFIGTGYDAETQQLAVYLTRVMLIQSFFMCLSGIAQGICHVYQQFAAPAIGPLLYNIAIILIGLVLIPYVGINGFAYGVVIGSFLNFAAHIPILFRIGVQYRPVLKLNHPGVRDFFVLALPVILGLSVIYLNLFVTNKLGTFLPEGTVTLLNNSNRLMQLPVGIFAIAIATAYFPSMARLVSSGDMPAFKEQLASGINLIFFILVPASVGLIVVREPLIRALFLQGEFTPENVTLTASALLFYAIGIVGYSQQQMLNRGFYAIRDTRTAVIINVVVILINIALSYALVGRFTFRGLAFAYSLAGLLSMVFLFILLRRSIGPMGGRRIALALSKTLLASLFMGLAVYWTLLGFELHISLESKWAQMFELLFGIGVGAMAYIGMALVLRIDEMNASIALVRRKFRH